MYIYMRIYIYIYIYTCVCGRYPWCNGYRRRKRVQILDKTDSISHCTNTLGKGMNPIILPPWENNWIHTYIWVK